MSATLFLIFLAAIALSGYRAWVKYQIYQSKLRTRIRVDYPIAELYAEGWRERVDPQPLIDEITSTVQPGEWSGAGGHGRIHFFSLSRSLIIRTNLAVHEEIKEFLDRKLTTMKRVKPLKDGNPGMDLPRTAPLRSG
ncbi:hypothetical protein P12x_000523 [Tundrisphaera lichenicola]|uniref:hypothetical protein n=1 Tax=Tundrisphaera lichenicola TaxID=2029860 RepID=UPI003EB9E945